MPKFSPISYKKLVEVFEAEGFTCARTEGDHMIFVKRGVLRPVVIPKYPAVPVFIIKNNLKTLKTDGISLDRYLELLEQESRSPPGLVVRGGRAPKSFRRATARFPSRVPVTDSLSECRVQKSKRRKLKAKSCCTGNPHFRVGPLVRSRSGTRSGRHRNS
jgi:predicted RNA binding protein YcfA (HicA-like mRNA interferase family)